MWVLVRKCFVITGMCRVVKVKLVFIRRLPWCSAASSNMQLCVWWLVHNPILVIGLTLLYGCSGALEYPTTNSCRPINGSLSLSFLNCQPLNLGHSPGLMTMRQSKPYHNLTQRPFLFPACLANGRVCLFTWLLKATHSQRLGMVRYTIGTGTVANYDSSSVSPAFSWRLLTRPISLA